MKNQECRDRLYKLSAIADINQRYHQRLEWRWGFADKVVRVAVALLAVAGIIATLKESQTAAIGLGFAAVAVALILNVVPFGDREKCFGEMFRRWGDLRRDVERLDVKLETQNSETVDTAAKPEMTDRLTELVERQHTLNAAEPAPFRKLLLECQGDHNESVWGAGIRTAVEVASERARRRLGIKNSSTGPEEDPAEVDPE